MWLARLKTALVLEEIEQISALSEEMPIFDSLAEMEEAAYLLLQAKELVLRNQQQTAQTLKQLKTTIDFLKSTHTDSSSSLNIKL